MSAGRTLPLYSNPTGRGRRGGENGSPKRLRVRSLGGQSFRVRPLWTTTYPTPRLGWDNALLFRNHSSGSGSTSTPTPTPTTTRTTQSFDSNAAPLHISTIQEISISKVTEAAEAEAKRLKEEEEEGEEGDEEARGGWCGWRWRGV